MGTWILKALGHSSTWGTQTFEGHFSSRALKLLGHVKAGRALGHSDIQDTRGLFFEDSYHVYIYTHIFAKALRLCIEHHVWVWKCLSQETEKDKYFFNHFRGMTSHRCHTHVSTTDIGCLLFCEFQYIEFFTSKLSFLPSLRFLLNRRYIKCYHQARTEERVFADFRFYLQIRCYKTSTWEGNITGNQNLFSL